MRVTQWIWAGPVAFVIHDAEEIATIERWLEMHAAQLPPIVQPLIGITTRRFAAAVVLLLVGFTLAAAHGARRAHRHLPSIPFLLVAGAFAANGATHLAQAAYFGGYTPGVLSAILIVLPYSVGLGRSLSRNGIVTRRTFAAAVVAGALLQVPIALLALAAVRGR
jgi:hypothetical protein